MPTVLPLILVTQPGDSLSADEYARFRADLKDEARLTLKDLTVDKPQSPAGQQTRKTHLADSGTCVAGSLQLRVLFGALHPGDNATQVRAATASLPLPRRAYIND